MYVIYRVKNPNEQIYGSLIDAELIRKTNNIYEVQTLKDECLKWCSSKDWDDYIKRKNKPEQLSLF